MATLGINVGALAISNAMLRRRLLLLMHIMSLLQKRNRISEATKERIHHSIPVTARPMSSKK